MTCYSKEEEHFVQAVNLLKLTIEYTCSINDQFCKQVDGVAMGDTHCVKYTRIKECSTAWKLSKYGVFSSPYFPAFGLNTERYEVCGKIRTRKNSLFGHISHSVRVRENPYSGIFYTVIRSLVFSDTFMKKMESDMVITLKPIFHKTVVDNTYPRREKSEPDGLLDKMISYNSST